MVTIVGVTPADFTGIERLGADAPDVTVPLAFDALFAPPARVEIPRMQQPTYWWLQIVGRLKPGVSTEQPARTSRWSFSARRSRAWPITSRR